jgi:phage terminase small subunit
MPALKNPKHESFAQAYAVIGNASEAWRRATGRKKDADVRAAEFMSQRSIKQRIAEIRAVTSLKSDKSKADLRRWLGEIIDGRIEAEPVQLRAGEILARMCGWNEPDKLEEQRKIEIVIRRFPPVPSTEEAGRTHGRSN